MYVWMYVGMYILLRPHPEELSTCTLDMMLVFTLGAKRSACVRVCVCVCVWRGVCGGTRLMEVWVRSAEAAYIL